MGSNSVRVTVSGSFHRHMAEIQEAVETFDALGHAVLSPADPRVVDDFGPFLYVASDKLRNIRGVQSRHFQSVRQSDFLWLVCPDGYVGTSAAMEVGFAIAERRPVFATSPPGDLTLRQYVDVVPSIPHAIRVVTAGKGDDPRLPHLLIDPPSAIDDVHQRLEQLRMALTRTADRTSYDDIDTPVEDIGRVLGLP